MTTPTFDIAFDQEIEKELDKDPSLFEDPCALHFESPNIKRARRKAEIQAAAQLPELKEQVILAIATLKKDGPKLLDEAEYTQAIDDFQNASLYFEKLNPAEITSSDSFKTLLHIKDSTIQTLEKLAVSKFDAEQYTECLALSSLILLLTPENATSWYRTAISAHKNAQFNLAIKAYDAAIDLDSTLLGAKIFKAHCCLALEQKDQAYEIYNEVKLILNQMPNQEPWQELLIDLKNLIDNSVRSL